MCSLQTEVAGVSSELLAGTGSSSWQRCQGSRAGVRSTPGRLRPCFHVRVAEGGVSLCRGRGAQLGTRSGSKESKDGALGLGGTSVPHRESFSLLREGFWRKPECFPRYPNRRGLWGSLWRDNTHGDEMTKLHESLWKGKVLQGVKFSPGLRWAPWLCCQAPIFCLEGREERRGGRAKAASGAAQAQPGPLPSEPTTLTQVHKRGLAQVNLGIGEGRGVGDPHGNQLCCPRCPRLKKRAQHLHGDVPAVLNKRLPNSNIPLYGLPRPELGTENRGIPSHKSLERLLQHLLWHGLLV